MKIKIKPKAKFMHIERVDDDLYVSFDCEECIDGLEFHYGEQGGRPPYTSTCLRCGGTGECFRSRESIEMEINDTLVEIKEGINSIVVLREYLTIKEE